MEVVAIGSLPFYIHDRRQTTAILTGDASLVQIGLTHQIGIYDREESEHVHRVEYGVAVVEYLGVLRSTAAHIDSAASLAC